VRADVERFDIAVRLTGVVDECERGFAARRHTASVLEVRSRHHRPNGMGVAVGFSQLSGVFVATVQINVAAVWLALIAALLDGRYIYLAPWHTSGPVARYDTTASFTAAASWSTFGDGGAT
jgi:hypothetical protein